MAINNISPINNLTFIDPDQYYVGLFGSVGKDALVENINMANELMIGDMGVGGIAGDNKGLIKNCISSGNIIGTRFVGGIVGYNNNEGTILDCQNKKDITGICITGGIAGENQGAVNNCKNFGNIIGVDCSVKGIEEKYAGNLIGGIIGLNNGQGTISQCENKGKVQGKNPRFMGEIVGFNKARASW